MLTAAAGAGALIAALPASAADDPAAVAEIVVTARKLDAARATIQPQIGASVYTLSKSEILSMPGGDNAALNQIVLQAPGVAQDSFGQLHVRGEHNGLQFRLNGVILPEGLSVFSQALNPRLADKVALITGALPAQYGLRTAGIVDIATRSGRYADSLVAEIYGGAHGEIQPSLQLQGGNGRYNGFAAVSYLHNDLGIESPDGRSTPLHDRTDQYSAFGFGEAVLNDQNKLSVIYGSSVQDFQIPDRSGLSPSILVGAAGSTPLNVLGQTTFNSAALNEAQREITHFVVASWLRDAGALTSQVSLFTRYSSLNFTPDVTGDLLFNGIAQNAFKQDVAVGIQAEGVWRVGGGHTVRFGLLGQNDRSISRTTSRVMALDALGDQLSNIPETIIDNAGHTARTGSLYLQDEWKPFPILVINAGLRLDDFDGARNESQLSPRANLVLTPGRGLTVHAGYARYFSPPPFELVAAATTAKFAGTTGASPCPASLLICAVAAPYAERASYFDAGFEQKLGRLILGFDSYLKNVRNMVDEGQFGAPIILTPFNFAHGRQWGLEATANYRHGPFSAYANFAYSRARGQDIVSGQFNFSPDELASIAAHAIPLDHEQTYTASGGASWRMGSSNHLSADVIYGSGLRTTAPGGTPNGAHLPGYVQVNLSASHDIPLKHGELQLRLDLINAFDRVYEIRDGLGVGVGAPQFGARRGLFAGLTRTF